MSSILTPGYLRWDGTKYILDHDVEIVGATGSAGPQGPTGLQGSPGIGVGASATGDISGIYPGPMSVISLTGVSNVVNFATGATNPTIGQASTANASGQPLTLKSQGAVGVGGNLILQSGTGSVGGSVQFLNGNTTAGSFDPNGILKIGVNSTSSATIYGTLVHPSFNQAGSVNDSLYSFSSSSFGNAIRVFSSASANRAMFEAANTASGASATISLRMIAGGPTEAVTQFQGNGVLEQAGAATSALVFSKLVGDGTGRGTTGRIYQSGAWAIGDNAINDTSAEAQAGLTGAVINLSPATGSFTSVATQALNFNIAGSHHIQGGTDVRFDVGTNLAGYFDSNRVLRAGLSASTNISTFGGSLNEPGNGIYAYNASGFNTIISASGAAASEGQVLILNTSAGASLTTGLRLIGAGASNGNTEWISNGVVEHVGSATSALVISSLLGDGTGRSTPAKFYRSGAVNIGSAANNNTSTLAQAGLTGPVLNISPTTGGTMTSAANQALNFNVAGSHHIQGNTDVRFDVGSTLAGYFDNNRAFRTGPNASTSVTVTTSQVVPDANTGLYINNTSNFAQAGVYSGLSTGAAYLDLFNTSGGAAGTTGIRILGYGPSASPATLAGNSLFSQVGSATSCMIFGSTLPDGTSFFNLGRMYRVGPWTIGEATNNDTSAEAQAGLTGPLLNISTTTGGVMTSTANQALLFNVNGAAHLQGHTDVRFDIAANLAGYFDSSSRFRVGPSATSTATLYGASRPTAQDYVYGFSNATSMGGVFITNAAAETGYLKVANTSAGGSATVGLTLFGAGATFPVTQYQGNSAIEHTGAAGSSIVFSQSAGDGTGFGVMERLYRSGALALGDTATNNTSTLAQAGLTGPLLNISTTTGGSMTSAANQMLLFNVNGSAHLQGNADVRFDVGATIAGYFDGNRTFRDGPLATTAATVEGTSYPIATVSNYANSSANNLNIFNTTGTAANATVHVSNNNAGTTANSGLKIVAGGPTNAVTAWQNNGVVEQTGSATSGLILSSVLGDGTNRVTTGRIWQSGAWAIGDNATNNTSSAAQAGLTGSLINLTTVSAGSVTSAANQAVIFNNAGTLNLQGNTGLNFVVGTATLSNLTSSKFVTSVGRRIKVTTTTSSPYTVLTTDEVVSIGTFAAPFTVNLPASPTTGDIYTIKDANGGATANNITVSGNGNNIDAAATATISTNYGTLTVVYNGTKWISI